MQLQVLVQGQLQPLVGVERGLLRAEAIGVEHVQLTVVDTGQLAQALVAVVQGVLGIDLVRQRLIALGLGFVHVGDGGQAHFEALLGLFKLTLDRGLVGTHEFQGIHGLEHVEVGLGGTQHQVLVLEVVGHVGLGGALLGQIQVDPVAATVDGLIQGHGAGSARVGHGVVLVLQVVQAGAQVDLGQQGCTGFVDLLEGLVPLGLGFQQLGVLDLGLLVNIEQVFGMSGAAHTQHHHD